MKEITSSQIIITLKKGREKSVLQRHPWIYSGAIETVSGSPELGETVRVVDGKGKFLAFGAYSPDSSIRVRIWSWTENEEINAAFFQRKLEAAFTLRKKILSAEEIKSCRVVYGEADGLPGFVVDRYEDLLVVQCLTAGAEKWRDVLVDELIEITSITNVYERSDVDVRKLEGLPMRTGVLRGEEPEQRIITENGLKFLVDVRFGQKTGFFVDQRRNRQLFGNFVENARILNCFCYTGAFSVYALAGKAQWVTSIDSSADALALAMQNVQLNQLDNLENTAWIEGDVFVELRRLRDRNEKFDVIVLDPPKFAPTVSLAAKAARGYKDINLLAFKLLNPGGLLFTFSCSGGVSEDLFQKIVAGAAADAGVNARIIYHMHQGPDHPIALHFPESAYLKGLVCQVEPF